MMEAMNRRILFALLLLAAPAWAQPGVNQPQPKLTEEPLVIITRDGTTALGQASYGTPGRAMMAPVAVAGRATIVCASVYLITGQGMGQGNLDILVDLADM
jgi:hypothetical protein